MLNYLDNNNLLNLINKNRLLIVAKNIVYDVTEYSKIHPGGKCILKNTLNKDLKIIQSDTDFNFHSTSAKKVWKKYQIGTINKNNNNCNIL